MYAPNVLILLTDSQATDVGGKYVQVTEAQNLKNEGVKIITVGMGREYTIKKFRYELRKMASKAAGIDNKPLHFEADFKHLDSISNTVVNEACSFVPVW